MFGDIGKLLSDGQKLQCHICGRWYNGLGTHIFRAHDMSGWDYKETFELRCTTALLGEESRDTLSASIRAVMDLEQLERNRENAVRVCGRGVKRRMESKMDPRYIEAKKYSYQMMRDGLQSSKDAGTHPPSKTDHMNLPAVRAKAIKTRQSNPEKAAATKKKISETLKAYFASHGPPTKPPITEETRKRISEAAKRRGISPETAKKVSETLKSKYKTSGGWGFLPKR